MGQNHTLRVIHKRTNMTETASNSLVIVSYKNKQFTDSHYFLNFFTLKISFADENDFENQWLEFSGMVKNKIT